MRVGRADILLIWRTPTHQYGILICLFSSLISFLHCVVLLVKILPVLCQIYTYILHLGACWHECLPSLWCQARVFSLLPLLLLPELVPAGPSGSVHSVTFFGKSEEHYFVIRTFTYPFISCLLSTSCYSVL